MKQRTKLLLFLIGLIAIIGVAIKWGFPSEGPSQTAYDKCLNRVSQQAAGNFAIFNVLRWEQCDKLQPKEVSMQFEDLVPKK